MIYLMCLIGLHCNHNKGTVNFNAKHHDKVEKKRYKKWECCRCKKIMFDEDFYDGKRWRRLENG